MNDQIDEIMGAFVAGIQALREAERRPAPLPAPRPQLRLVYSDSSRPRAQREGLGEAEMRMRWYAKNIRAFREGVIDLSKIDFAEDRPKLTLVDTVGTESEGTPK